MYRSLPSSRTTEPYEAEEGHRGGWTHPIESHKPPVRTPRSCSVGGGPTGHTSRRKGVRPAERRSGHQLAERRGLVVPFRTSLQRRPVLASYLGCAPGLAGWSVCDVWPRACRRLRCPGRALPPLSPLLMVGDRELEHRTSLHGNPGPSLNRRERCLTPFRVMGSSARPG
jgi:hypothetical protein